eukprot:TRINITY_DN10069_c0_g1_i1.p1 TRINITY_DN10069_c0_g1~~TRINITY_DN10069_c0_g1_i1.p1  ORF type:complete len:561 (-),score=122.16 TRINITY_DN10069_c0_g1_i1:49-1731(-)
MALALPERSSSSSTPRKSVSLRGRGSSGRGSSILQTGMTQTSTESKWGGKLNTSHVARPDASSGWKLMQKVVAGSDMPEDILGPHELLLKSIQDGYTPVNLKEDALQSIMSKEAHASFDCLGRHQMEPAYATRSSLNPVAIQGKTFELQKLIQNIGEKDLDAPAPLEEAILAKLPPVKKWQAQPGELSLLRDEITDGLGCKFGAALPASSKMGFASVVAGAASSKMKAGGVLAKAVDLSPERAFAARSGDYCMAGIVNAMGHPKTAGALALLVARELPDAFFQSPAFVLSKRVDEALSEAFAKVHMLASLHLDVVLTGAAVSVVVVSKEHLWVAHVGDCRVVLGVPDQVGSSRDFHVAPVPLTEDHKLCVKTEFDRIKEAGGEVRKLMHDQVCRVFVNDSPFPCLALTRCVGSRLGHTVGITHKPAVSMLKRKDLAKGSVILLASAGLWANVSEKTAVNWVSRDFPDLQAAAMSLASETAKRWEAPASMARGNLDKSVSECFSTFVIRLEAEQAEKSASRKFVIGPPVTVGTPRKQWDEVKAPDRVLELRRMVQSATPRQ